MERPTCVATKSNTRPQARSLLRDRCYACRRAVSVCPSIRLYVTSCILSKRINISSNFFHRRVATPFYVFPYQPLWHPIFVGRLGSGPHPVGQIGSAVRVSASFQIFALRNCYISMRGLPLGDFCNSLGISPALSSHRITVAECMNDSTSLKCIN